MVAEGRDKVSSWRRRHVTAVGVEGCKEKPLCPRPLLAGRETEREEREERDREKSTRDRGGGDWMN